jgi:hypothetical protein
MKEGNGGRTLQVACVSPKLKSGNQPTIYKPSVVGQGVIKKEPRLTTLKETL